MHSKYSDGRYTPTELVDLARRSGLSAIALTDHDTLDGLLEAREAAIGSSVEIVSGVEISTEYRGSELHLLGYYVHDDNRLLLAALAQLRTDRVARFWEMADRLRGCGVAVDDDELRAFTALDAGTLGRRNLAEFLVKTRRAGSVREAFVRYLGDRGRVAVPKVRLPVAEAIAIVRGAGGVAAWAHPSYDCTRETLSELRGTGLGAVEAEYPTARRSRRRELRGLARELGLAVTGGSDCHGPDQPRRMVGTCSISMDELEQLRRWAQNKMGSPLPNGK
jgi:predicted metal-dependent phosphoesterase TrpH